MSDQAPLFGALPAEPGGPEWPRLYVACALTAVADRPDARERLALWTHVIEEAIKEQTAGGDVTGEARSWCIVLDVPLKRTSPWKNKEATPVEIYEQNSASVWARADAMIVIGAFGGSTGAGQELEWALRQGIPILYVVPPGESASRQVRGAENQGDLTIQEFEEPDELKRAVARWIAKHRSAIEDGARRRAMTRSRFLVAQTVVRYTWARLDIDGRCDFCARTRLRPALINRIVSDLDAFAALSGRQLVEISAGLGIDLGVLLGVPGNHEPALSERSLRALQQAADESSWDGPHVIDLILDAQHVLATPATRRLPLGSMQDWIRFDKRRQQ